MSKINPTYKRFALLRLYNILGTYSPPGAHTTNLNEARKWANWWLRQA